MQNERRRKEEEIRKRYETNDEPKANIKEDKAKWEYYYKH